MSDTLLEIIARLQQPGALSLAQGRQILLDYARKRARARLGLLFLLDPAGQHLRLVEQCGHAPRHEVIVTIPVDGLFALTLQETGLLCINERDVMRALPAERGWMWRGGRVLLCAVGVGAASDALVDESRNQTVRQGIIALFSDARTSTEALSKKAEQDILLCAALLGSYLDGGDELLDGRELDARVPDAQQPDAHKGHPYMWADPSPEDGMGGREMGALAGIYEAGLVDNADGERGEQMVCQRVLDSMLDMLDASSGSLWVYAPSRGQFGWGAGSGADGGSDRLVESELEQLAGAMRQGGYAGREYGGARVVTWSRGRMVTLHLLTYGGTALEGFTERDIVGAVAFVIEGRQDISKERHVLLTYGCRAAALVIRDCQRRAAGRQAAIDAERSRMARDIHDGAAQQIAHAIHSLEYAERVAERQPGLAREEIGQARVTLVESLNSLRQSIAALLPTHLEQASLGEALAALLDDFRRDNAAISLSYEGFERAARRWPPSLDVPIYRLIQEALQNIQKHAQAARVTVRMHSLPGLAVVEVSDDGVGFDVERARRGVAGMPSRFGLRSMQERVERADGVFTLSSRPGEGTTVKACFPLPARAMALTGREREVLRLLVEGASNRVMAEQLSVSVETVKSHMHHIMQKLGVRDRTQAAVLAARQRWV